MKKLGILFALTLGFVGTTTAVYAHDYDDDAEYDEPSAPYSMRDLSAYAGTYRLIDERRGDCQGRISVGITNRNGIGVLSVGDTLFPAINGGWREYTDRSGITVRSHSHIAFHLFTHRPTLRNLLTRWNDSGLVERRSVIAKAIAGDRMELKTRRHLVIHGHRDIYESSKCIYARAYASEMPAPAPIPAPKSPKDEGNGQGPDQGWGK